VNRIPILDVKEIEAAAEDAQFMVGLDAQALARVQASQTPLQKLQVFIVHRGSIPRHEWPGVIQFNRA
jgi:hypothetical protein